MDVLPRESAEEYSSWFRCLADGTRLRVLNAVASSTGPLTVGDVVGLVGAAQSTVSHHLTILAGEGFVFLESEGNRTWVTVNRECMSALPAAATEIMGQSAKQGEA